MPRKQFDPGEDRSKLTPEVADLIVQFYKSTGLFADACKHAGVSRRAATAWRYRGRNSFSGRYYDFDRRMAAAEAQVIAPIVNQLIRRATGGIIKQPKRKRYLDDHGIWRQTDEAVLDENGQPVMELIVVEPSEKAQIFLLERMRPAEFGDTKTLQIEDNRDRDMETRMARQMTRRNKENSNTNPSLKMKRRSMM